MRWDSSYTNEELNVIKQAAMKDVAQDSKPNNYKKPSYSLQELQIL